MKTILLFGLFSISLGYSQVPIKVAVWTDKTIYSYGDTLSIVVTVVNLSADTVDLVFPDAAQGSFTIDDFIYYHHVGWTQAPTHLILSPYQIHIWNYRHPMEDSNFPLPSNGVHSIVGEVVGYALSDTLTIIVDPVVQVPVNNVIEDGFFMDQNYPNPFNPTTTIRYLIPRSGFVEILLFDVLGRLMKVLESRFASPGQHEIKADLHELPSGTYFYRMQFGEFITMKKLTLLE